MPVANNGDWHKVHAFGDFCEFCHAGNVQATAGELTKKLAAQGWKKDGSDLVTAKSAILNRKQGDASLTIFVKPDGKGSVVTMMTEGLDWTDK